MNKSEKEGGLSGGSSRSDFKSGDFIELRERLFLYPPGIYRFVDVKDSLASFEIDGSRFIIEKSYLSFFHKVENSNIRLGPEQREACQSAINDYVAEIALQIDDEQGSNPEFEELSRRLARYVAGLP